MARIVRGQIISLKNQEFIEAAISLGLSGHRILFRHLIPNVLGPIIIYATLLSECDASGSGPEFPWTGCSTAAQFLGGANR